MTNTPDFENQAVSDIRAKQAADPRVSMTRKQCQTEGNWGQTTQIAKENRGVLRRYLDGLNVRITTKSFYEHLIALASAPAKKARQPSTRFGQRRRRQPTPQELEGLKIGNAKRKAEAQARREAKASTGSAAARAARP